MCVCVSICVCWGHVCATVLCEVQNTTIGCKFFFLRSCHTGDQTQAIKLGGKYLYILSQQDRPGLNYVFDYHKLWTLLHECCLLNKEKTV